MDQALCWHVETVCRNARPALRELPIDGWLLRFSEGERVRRTNSVNPARAGLRATPELVSEFEVLYRERRLTPLFRIPEIAQSGLDALLDARGYGSEGETLTLFRNLGAQSDSPDPQVALASRPSSKWLEEVTQLIPQLHGDAALQRKILAAMKLDAAFATIERDGRIVSAAYAALQDGLACIESVVTASDWRRQGLARRIALSLFDWARKKGGTGVCLQVAADNPPALALYRNLGFSRELYRYHYRRAAA